MGQCKKCTTEVPSKAQKCPQCGYEPGRAILGGIGKIVGVLLMTGAVFQVLFGFVILITPLFGVPILSGLVGGAIFVGAGSFQGLVAEFVGKFGTYYVVKQDENEANSVESKPFLQQIRDAQQDENNLKNRWRRWVDQLPSVVFSSVIFTGFTFSLIAVVVIGNDQPIAGVPVEDVYLLPLFAGAILMYSAVVSDVGRLNRRYEGNFRWWFWSILVIVPVIGIIPGAVWIWRRRRHLQYIQNSN